MDTAAEILLIIVSATLAIFLLTLTIALVYLIKVLKRADEVADSIENTATAIKRGAAAMPFVRLAAKLINRKRRS